MALLLLLSSWLLLLAAPVTSGSSSGRRTYHVDSRTGDDAATGLSAAAPWRSLRRVRAQALAGGDSVLFARGAEFRGFLIASAGDATRGNVTYGAFGDEHLPLPLLLGSVSPAASDWQLVAATGSIWVANISRLALPLVGPHNNVTDVGNLILRFGKEPSHGLGLGEKLGRKHWTAAALSSGGRFAFFFNRSSHLLLVHSPDGNPVAAAQQAGGTIECALQWSVCQTRLGPRACAPPAESPADALVWFQHVQHVVFRDLAVRFTGGDALAANGAANLTIANCDIRWVGGGVLIVPPADPECTRGTCTRFGNGIELWMGNSDISVHNNTLDQIYDAAVTNQGSGGPYTQQRISWSYNRISNSEYCWEVWDHSPANESVMADITFSDNTCRESGGGWSHHVRPDPSGLHVRMGTTSATVGAIHVVRNSFAQDVSFAGGMWIWDSPWASPADSQPNVVWGSNLTTDSNRWCLRNASLGPLIVWGVPLNDNFTRITAGDFESYRRLTSNAKHSTVVEGEGACGPR